MQIAINRLQPIKCRFAAQCRAGRFNSFGAIHPNESIQVLQRFAILFLCKQQQGLQAV